MYKFSCFTGKEKIIFVLIFDHNQNHNIDPASLIELVVNFRPQHSTIVIGTKLYDGWGEYNLTPAVSKGGYNRAITS